MFPRTNRNCFVSAAAFFEVIQRIRAACHQPKGYGEKRTLEWSRNCSFVSILHAIDGVSVCLKCASVMVSFLLPCSSSSHPETGWARAASWYLHRVHGSGLPPSKAALVPQARGDSTERLHPNWDGLLPGLSRGLSHLPEPNAHQQWQLHFRGQQHPWNSHQDSVWSLPHGPGHRWWWVDLFCFVVNPPCACGSWYHWCPHNHNSDNTRG